MVKIKLKNIKEEVKIIVKAYLDYNTNGSKSVRRAIDSIIW